MFNPSDILTQTPVANRITVFDSLEALPAIAEAAKKSAESAEKQVEVMQKQLDTMREELDFTKEQAAKAEKEARSAKILSIASFAVVLFEAIASNWGTILSWLA